jgi:ribosomal protein S18 acetylase RimI-like enzyme
MGPPIAPLPPGLPDFPAADRPVGTPPGLAAQGVNLRRACGADLAWLNELYASTREEGMAPVPWPAKMKRAFLADQFGLQHRHYVAHHPDADFLVLESRHGPIGRYYLRASAPDHLLVDICLLPAHRGQGIGHALIRASQDEAARQGRGMYLHVLQANDAARRLYERLGFVVTGEAGLHLEMRWAPAAPG